MTEQVLAPGGNSKKVESNQEQVHTELEKIVRKHLQSAYKKPIADHTKQSFDVALKWSLERNFSEFVLDTGCGTGESSVHLAKKYPHAAVWGIDKSEDRLERSDKSQIAKIESLPPNLLYVRADLVDLWLLVQKNQLKVIHQALYYPNPWPKSAHIKRRWHAHPIFQTILAVGGTIELRTNWEIYAEEFVIAMRIAGREMHKQSFIPVYPQTAFERKYQLSGHSLFKVCDLNHM